MRNPLRALRDFSRTKPAAAQLLDAVKKSRPGGVDVSRQDPELAAAVLALLKDEKWGPRLRVARFKHNLTLGFVEDFKATTTPTLLAGMEAAGVFVKNPEDL